MKKLLSPFTLALLLLPAIGLSQLNSPYSRYGIGNLTNPANTGNRAMGGISAATSDAVSINSINPASYGSMIYTTVDVSLEYNGMTLKSKQPVETFQSHYALFNYLTVGVPLLSGNKKALASKTNWALVFGLRPESRISYKTLASTRTAIDSVSYLYEGDGGLNKAFIGSALKLNNLSVGFNTGFVFGQKDYSTHLIFHNDSLPFYKALYQTNSQVGGVFFDVGAQYQVKLKKGHLRFGAYSNLGSTPTAHRDEIRETFTYDEFGAPNRIDSVYEKIGEKGKVVLPATYGVGVVFENDNLLIGADYETSQWKDYRFFGQKDPTTNLWNAKIGLQYLPATSSSTSYFSFVKYRAGFSFGKDYILIDDEMPVYTISAGAAFPLRLRRSFFDHQFSLMNVTFEYGNRGNKNNNITESFYRVSLGFSLNDVWFLRQKYQ